MKKCPYCAEEIQDEAIKCRYCNEFLNGHARPPSGGVLWFFRTHIIVLAFLCVGPFALPLVWFHPRYSTTTKVVISAIAVIVSALLVLLMRASIKSIMDYYKLIFSTG